MIDLFIATGEMSADLHGSKLIEALLKERPQLKIGAVAGPKMRKLPITEFFPMENLMVMGFVDVLLALPKIRRNFLAIRNKILELNPKAVVCIDYPGFHLRLEKSLRKKGFQGKLIHFICPTVWAWGKKRIPAMAKNLDLLLTIFPFEKGCFSNTKLPVEYIGHPLTEAISNFVPTQKFKGKILGIFPGSRKHEIERNLPIQLRAAQKLQKQDPSLIIAISMTQFKIDVPGTIPVEPEDHYELMRASHLAIATSGTVTLELALHKTPTIVNFAIKPLDLFIAQKILRIDLPFFAMPNIVANELVFPELFGPHLTDQNLDTWAQKLWFDPAERKKCFNACEKVEKILGKKCASQAAAIAILNSFVY
jgi:lipid-A-disaccharide synthase